MRIEQAKRNDAVVILQLIKELAAYENMSDQVLATIDDVKKTLFCENPKAEVFLLKIQHEIAGFALFFHNYSTFLCKYGIYIEDIYVREEHRGNGYGKAFLQYICKLAKNRDCGRIEWWCLNWNQPSIDFYLNLGAEAMSDWTVYRLNQKTILKLAE